MTTSRTGGTARYEPPELSLRERPTRRYSRDGVFARRALQAARYLSVDTRCRSRSAPGFGIRLICWAREAGPTGFEPGTFGFVVFKSVS